MSPSESPAIAWPSLRLDPVARLRAIAAGLPHAAFDEVLLDAPVARVWELVGDLEHGTRQFERTVKSARIVSGSGGEGDELELAVRSFFGVPLSYRVELRFGFCLMRARHSQVGMAAAPAEDGARTRFAHFESAEWLGRAARPLLAWNIRGDFRRIAQILARSV